ncbi:hypothetical protein J2X13_001206 [Aminobacter aminovorans]|nr:hypothetical protein [Aminobacter aminovorans]
MKLIGTGYNFGSAYRGVTGRRQVFPEKFERGGLQFAKSAAS